MAKKRIGIVGGGIVGTCVAYFLTHEYEDVEVHLFEKNPIPTLLLYGPDGRETAEHRRAYFREEEQAL